MGFPPRSLAAVFSIVIAVVALAAFAGTLAGAAEPRPPQPSALFVPAVNKEKRVRDAFFANAERRQQFDRLLAALPGTWTSSCVPDSRVEIRFEDARVRLRWLSPAAPSEGAAGSGRAPDMPAVFLSDRAMMLLFPEEEDCCRSLIKLSSADSLEEQFKTGDSWGLCRWSRVP